MEILVSSEALNGLSNYNELVAYAKEQVAPYAGLVVQEEDLSAAKSVVARMRKVAKTASDLRISTEREHKAKIELTISQLKEISGIFTQAADKVDAQVKEIKERRANEKMNSLREYFNEKAKSIAWCVGFEDIIDPKWANVTVGEDTAKGQIDEIIARYSEDANAVKEMEADPSTKVILEKEFKRTKNLAAVIRLKNELDAEKKKREEEEQKRSASSAEEVQEQTAVSYTHEVALNETQNVKKDAEDVVSENELVKVEFCVTTQRFKLAGLKAYMLENGIRYGRVER